MTKTGSKPEMYIYARNPLDIDLPNSDLDIIRELCDFDSFEEFLKQEFKHCENFHIEWFGQLLLAVQQPAYKHMVVEYRVLNILGGKAKAIIKDLKRRGIKTEPAFGQLLQLNGLIPFLSFD